MSGQSVLCPPRISDSHLPQHFCTMRQSAVRASAQSSSRAALGLFQHRREQTVQRVISCCSGVPLFWTLVVPFRPSAPFNSWVPAGRSHPAGSRKSRAAHLECNTYLATSCILRRKPLVILRVEPVWSGSPWSPLSSNSSSTSATSPQMSTGKGRNSHENARRTKISL
jgi:hypothetical protein